MADCTKQEKLMGIIVKASPVEVATPHFKKKSNSKCDPLIYSSILTGNGVQLGEPDSKILAGKIDLNKENFQPIPNNLFSDETNSLLALCHLGFAEHRPIALTPDLLWHYISKEIAIHVHKYSEELRHKFVNHNGKMELTVTRDKLDLSESVWSEALKEFRGQISDTLTDNGKALISSNFSTTSEVIEDVACITLMDTLSKYYSYRFHILCGIPSVTLLGTKDDWLELRAKTEAILDVVSSSDLEGDVSLAWWKVPLLDVLAKLISCYDNPDDEENQDWMARIYKSAREDYGGEAQVCGWVNVFFPYLGQGQAAQHYKINKWATTTLLSLTEELKEHFRKKSNDNCVHGKNVSFEEEDRSREFGNSAFAFPRAISSTPFVLDINGEEHKMNLSGGPCCISEQLQSGSFPCPPGTLHAHFGWIIKKEPETRQG